MPQVFQVVRCCECSTYQVDIKKSSTNKWTCKLCNTKQSLKQVYFEGESSECRDKVRLFNQLRLEAENKKDELRLDYVMQKANSYNQEEEEVEEEEVVSNENFRPRVSKWAKYLDSSDKDF